jgi:hypothetical protein
MQMCNRYWITAELRYPVKQFLIDHWRAPVSADCRPFAPGSTVSPRGAYCVTGSDKVL